MSSEEREKFEEFEAEGSKLTGRDKYIYPLHTYRRTRARFAVFDTETRTIKSEKVLSKTKRAAERLELRYIYLRLHDSSDNYVKPMAFDFNTEMDAPDREQKRWFTKKLVQLARTNSYLTIWAHNAMFDVSAAIDFDWLSRGTQTHRFEYTFVSTHPFIFKIKGQAREKGSKPFLLRFLDTYSFYKYSLETLAPYFGLSKVPIDFEKLEKSGDEANPELLAMRCKTDVDITEAIVTDLYGRMRGKVAVSAPQMAFNTFRTMLSKPIEKLGGLSIDSYHGGRTEIFKRMVQPRSMRLDINSMYPFAMCKPLPVSHGMHVENPGLDYLLDECKSGRYVASIRAIVKVPPKYIGPFPYWNGTRLLFPTGEFETTINSPELLAVDSWKYVERVLEADFFRAEPFLENYSRKFYAAKLEASRNKDRIGREYNKLLLNSLFGKFGQKHKETVPLPEKMLAELPPEHVWTGVEDIELAADYPDFGLSTGDVVHAVFVAGQPVFSREVDYNISPAVASFITSWARSRLYELMETRASENLIYVDTDSLVIPESIEHRFKDVIGDEMGKLKIEFRGTFIGFAPKVYIFNGTDDEGKKKLEVKSKGVPRDLFLKAIKNGEKTVTFNHILGFHERLRGYNTVSLLRSDITRSLSLTDSKRRWLGDNTSMPIEMTMA